MAAENIKSVTPLFSEKMGSRIFAVAEIILGKEYKTEGMELSEKQLIECGLTLGQVDVGWVITSGLVAKNAEQPILQFNITNPSATPYPKAEAQKVKIQAYESITTALNKELATTSEKAKEAPTIIALIGR